ncbi:hypothetical protein KJ678_03310 [Patescibacteria group bacterium]|nr:hypothetical protein [Patescibacteria group bacterium]
MDSIVKKSIIKGIIGGFVLLAFYFGVLSLANSFSHAISQFYLLWYWILALVIGFSIQVSLWSYIHSKMKEKKTKEITGEVTATGGISAGSMVACCAHHLVDIVPLLGFSTLFLFLAQYQIFFLILGILSNILGIILMLEIIQKHSLYQKENVFWNYSSKINFKILKKLVIVGAIIILIISFFRIKNLTTKLTPVSLSNPPIIESRQEIPMPQTENLSTASLPTKNNEGSGLSIDVTPIDFSPGKLIQFEIAFNTHQGNLDLDLTQQSVLIDDFGNTYLPLEWQGGRGGHHLSGKLIFPPLKSTTKTLKLAINNVYGIKERIFEWGLE